MEVKIQNSKKIMEQYQVIDQLEQENSKLNKMKSMLESERQHLN